MLVVFFFSSRRRHTIFDCDWSSDVCSSDLAFSDALFACPERREPLVACWPAGLLPADVSGCQFLLSAALVHAPTAFVPAPTVRAPIPIASLAAAILRFLCVAVHSLGAHHAIAVDRK